MSYAYFSLRHLKYHPPPYWIYHSEITDQVRQSFQSKTSEDDLSRLLKNYLASFHGPAVKPCMNMAVTYGEWTDIDDNYQAHRF